MTALPAAQAEAVDVARRALDGARPAVVAHEAWWAYGLELLLPETVLLCAQRSSIIDALRARGVDVFCLSEHVEPAEAEAASAVEVFAHPAAAGFCRRAGRLAVVATKPSERLAAGVQAAGGRLVTPPAALAAARRFENKLAFIEIARSAGVPTPRWEAVGPADRPAYEELAARLGPRLVVQAARGNGGQRTWMVESAGDLGRAYATEEGHPLRLADMVVGEPITATGVAGGEAAPLAGVVEACRQLTGVAWLTPMRLGSCGNVFGDPAMSGHQAAARAAVGALAGELSAAGYRGLFGVDFVVGPEGPVVIETNPRVVASMPLVTQLEVEAGRVPLTLRHLVAGLGGPEIAAPADELPLPAATQVIVRRLPTTPPLVPRCGRASTG